MNGGSHEWRIRKRVERREASVLQSTYYVWSAALGALLMWPGLISEVKLLSPGREQAGNWTIQACLAILCNSQGTLFREH